MTNRNTRSGKLAFLLIALVVLVGFQPGPAKTQDIEQLRKDAEQGDVIAQYNLGVMYATGEGVPQDDKEAVKWLRLAAEQGYSIAQYNLGVMYATGEGVSQDYQEALKWYRKAADQGRRRPPLQPPPQLPLKSKLPPPLNWSTFSPPEWSSFTPPLTRGLGCSERGLRFLSVGGIPTSNWISGSGTTTAARHRTCGKAASGTTRTDPSRSLHSPTRLLS